MKATEKKTIISQTNIATYFIKILKTHGHKFKINDIIETIKLKTSSTVDIEKLLSSAISTRNSPEKQNTNKTKQLNFADNLQLITLLNEQKNTHNQESCWSIIPGYQEINSQLELEKEMRQLGMHFTPLCKIHNNTINRTRIIFTDIHTSTAGFKYILNWAKLNINHNTDINEIKNILKNYDVQELNKSKLKPADLDLELAWLHLMNNGRHLEENVVFVGDLDSLEYAIQNCTPDSTLVLSGHGGQNEFTISIIENKKPVKKKLRADELAKYMNSLVNIINKNITHVILQACATGSIKQENLINSEGKVYIKDKYDIAETDTSNLERQKNRKKIFFNSSENSLGILINNFEKITDNKESLANILTKLIFKRKDSDKTLGTAFTFSPTIIHPGIAPKFGVIAAPKGLNDNRLDWPQYNTDWKKDGSGLPLKQVAYKSYTIYNNIHNRKAINYQACAWKKTLDPQTINWINEKISAETNPFSIISLIIMKLIETQKLASNNKFIELYNNAPLEQHTESYNNIGYKSQFALIESYESDHNEIKSYTDKTIDIQDILFIADKLGCVTQVYEYQNNTDKSIIVHIIKDDPSGIILHVKNIGLNNFSMAIQNKRPEYETMSWPKLNYNIYKKNKHKQEDIETNNDLSRNRNNMLFNKISM